jgi:hypothetical protein
VAQVETVRPLCILERTVEMDRAEADLWCALFTIVGGARPLITVEQVRQAVALSFNIGLDSLEVVVAEPEEFSRRTWSSMAGAPSMRQVSPCSLGVGQEWRTTLSMLHPGGASWHSGARVEQGYSTATSGQILGGVR